MKAISFDVDGTLVDRGFTDSIWFEGIPKLYARKFEVPFEDALEHAKREYRKVGPWQIEWYDIKYWFARFSLGSDWKSLMEEYRSKVRVYPEVFGVLERLSSNFELLIASAAGREFLDPILEESKLDKYFTRTFSAVSDYGRIGKDAEFYSKVCQALGLAPEELAHVGDDWDPDFVVPRRCGVRAIYLDRRRERSGEFIIHDLTELVNLLLG